ncbi:MAG: Flp family type IVb pilin [Chloroflexota bacterium]
MLELYVWLNKLLKREEGQGLVEYALIIFLVAIAVITALTLLGTQVSTIFGNITTSLGT